MNTNAMRVVMSLNACVLPAMAMTITIARPAEGKRRRSSYRPSVPFLRTQAKTWAAAPALHTLAPPTVDSPDPDSVRQFAVPAGKRVKGKSIIWEPGMSRGILENKQES